MSFAEWSKAKKKEKEEREQKTISFSEWSNRNTAANVNQEYIDSFFADTDNFFKNSEQRYTSLGWSNAESLYSQTKQDWYDLKSRAKKVGAWVEYNKDKLDEETYKSFTDSLKAISDNGNSILVGFYNNNKHFSQFETEDAYNAWKKFDDEQKAILDLEDFEQYSQLGANIENPEYDDARVYKHNLWEILFKDKISNPVTFGRNNKESLKKTIGLANSSADVGYANEYYRYNLLTDDEASIYNYYLGKGDTQKAEEYLAALEDTLNRREAHGIVENIDDSKMLSLIFSAGVGLDRFASGMASIDNYLMGTEADPTTSTQYASSEIRNNLDGFWGGAYDLTSNTFNMLPSILVGSVTGGLGGRLTMGASTLGNAYSEMSKMGYSDWQSRGYATAVTIAEMELQKLLGGIGALGGKHSLSSGITKLVGKFDHALAKLAIQVPLNMASEGLEEAIQTVLEPAFKALMTGEDFEAPEWEEIWYSGLLGALSAGLLDGAPTIAGTAIYNNNVKKAYGNDIEAILTEARTNENTGKSVDKYIEKYGKKGTLSGWEINNLLEITDAQKVKSSVESKLTSLGESGDVSQLADIITKQVQGIELSKAEQKTLDSSTYGKRMINSLNPENIRSGEYDTDWVKDIGTRRLNASEYNQSAYDIVKEAILEAEASEGNPVSENASVKENASKISAEDVKTTITKGDETVDVKVDKIESIDGDEISLKLDNGEVVNASDVDFGGQIGLVYQAAKDMSSRVGGFGIDVANVFVKGYTADSKLTAAEYVHGFSDAYRFGKMGYPTSELESGVYTSKLSKEQRETAYNFGKAFGNEEVAKKSEKIVSTVTINAENIANNASKKKKGRVHFDGSVAGKTLTERQKASLKGLGVVAEAMGIDIHVFESKLVNGKREGANGWYDPVTKEIHIDLHAGEKGDALMLFTASHELTHHIREVAPGKFKIFADALLEEYTKNGVSVEKLIEQKKQFLEEKGRLEGKTEEEAYDLAYEEVVADSAEAMLVDSNAIEALSRKIHEKDKGLWNTIKSFISKLVARIKEAYKGLNPDSAEANYVRDMVDSAERLQKLWVDALLEASDMVEIDTNTESVAPMFSERTWTESEYVTEREETAKKISKALGVSLQTAYKYIDDINGVARLIADDRARLDYEPNLDDSASVLKPNSDYKFSVDMSTLCAKRLLFTGTFDAIQKALPNTVFDSEDIVSLREMMQKRGYEVACGICYVESTRREIGRITQEFIDRYKVAQKTGKPISRINSSGKEVVLKSAGRTFSADKTYTPNLGELNTTDIDIVKRDHREVYDAYLAFMNARGQAKPKLLETRAEYKGEILKHFKAKSSVEARNNSGGLRLQSFSDFEVPHMIDMMQIVMDMSRVGLKSQAYTKVPAFAEVFGDSGVKINLSLIAKGDGLDSKGNLVFDDVEGINHKEAFALRDKYSKNVGTILVGKTDAHIIAAMADPRIDYIIPFHKSSWKESLYDALGLTGYADYTDTQNEKPIDKSRSIKNYDPSEYWDFTKSGDENAQKYLEMCREDGRIPKFPQFQGYPGYWKLLIDFKMYDNDGVGSPQEVVNPIFNTEASERILHEYKGGHKSFPVAKDVVEDFVKEHKGNAKYSDRDAIDKYREKRYNLYNATKDFTREVAPNDRKAFARSLANKTSDMVDGEVRTVWIYSTAKVYLFRADGYMHGDVIRSFSADNKQMLEDIGNEYDKIDQSTENASLWSETVQSDEGGLRSYSSVFGRGRSDPSDTLYEDSSGSDTSRYTERERPNPRTKEEVDEIVKKLRDMYGLDAKNSDIRYSDRDSEGNALSKEQQTFFRDSKVRDEDGNLLKVYHGSPNKFTTFRQGVADGWGKGIYFTNNRAEASTYGKNVVEAYLNIKNPYNADTMSYDEIGAENTKAYRDFDKRIWENRFAEYDSYEEYKADGMGVDLYEIYTEEVEVFNQILRELGYDGIIAYGSNDIDGFEIVAFNENQPKLTSNKNPSDSKDIRYSDRNTATFKGKPFWSGSVSLLDGVIEEVHTIEEAEDADFHHSMYFSPAQVEKMENGENAFFWVDDGKVQGDWRESVPKAIIKRIEEQIKVKYQDRNTDSYSNRSLLANALETAVQNDIEREKLKQYKQKIDLINAEEQKLHDLREQIKELSFKKGARDTQAIKNLQFEANQAANRINTYDRQLLNLESTKALKGVLEREKAQARKRAEKQGKEALERYRERAAKTQRELMDRYQESRKRGVESRNKTAMRHKIKDVVNELNNYLLKGTKEKHIPIELQKVVAEALDAVNMDTVGADERIAKLKAEMLRAKTPEAMQEIAKKIDHIEEMGGNMEAKISRLKTAYDGIINSEDPLIANSHDEVISNTIGRVMEVVGDTPLRDMSLYQLEAVYDMYRMVLHSIRTANKAFKAKKSEEISVIANRVLEEIDKLKKKNPLRTKVGDAASNFDWNNLKPVYAFERIGSGSFTEVFNNVRTGEDTWAVDMTEAQAFLEAQKKDHGYNSWDLNKKYQFTSSVGESFDLTVGQIMSLYAYAKRGDQAKDHLKNGGFVFDGLTEVKKKNKLGVTKTYRLKNPDAYNISEEILAEITSKLSPEQKAFADAMQDYLSTTMGEKGNEVSLELYGVKLFKEKNYFPLKSAPQYLERAREQAEQTTKIKNKGFTKETSPKAKNPIVLTSFMDVWAGHVNEMSMYHAFTLALEDFYRVFNYKTPAAENMKSVGVIPFIEKAHGDAAVSYIDQLLKDLNGGTRSDPREHWTKPWISRFKKTAVMGSLSVVVQQPTAIVRAMALVDAKYFGVAPISSGVIRSFNRKKHKALWEEVKKYAPVAIIKDMGYFDTGMGKSSEEWLKGEKTFMDKVDDFLAKAPAIADELAWISIWNAVKRETASKNPSLNTNSEEFLKLAGERFTEVITKTQVYDSTLSKSSNMRSKSAFMNMWTSFMAEPTTTINMVMDAFRKGDKKYVARVLGATVGSIALNAALVSLVYAMRDDDEDETFAEKYVSRFTTELVDGINPVTYLPFFKDVWSLMQGFDIERADMSLINDLIGTAQTAFKALTKDTSDMSEDELAEHQKSVADALWGIVDSITSLAGIPEKNIRRDINGIINLFKTLGRDMDTTYGSLMDNIGEDLKDSIPVWGWLPDESKGDKLYDAIIKGDTAYVDRLKSGYKSEKAYESAVRSALREHDPRIKEAAQARYDGDLSEYTRIAKEIIAEGNFSQDTVVGAINSEISAIKKGEATEDETEEEKDEATSIYSASDINAAFENGDTATALEIIDDLIKTKVANGKTEKEAKSSLRSSMTSYWKPLYKNASESERIRIRKILYASGLYGNANEVVKDVAAWLKD